MNWVVSLVGRIGLRVLDRTVFVAIELHDSVKSCICFSSRCLFVAFVEFDVASFGACIYIVGVSSVVGIGGFV